VIQEIYQACPQALHILLEGCHLAAWELFAKTNVNGSSYTEQQFEAVKAYLRSLPGVGRFKFQTDGGGDGGDGNGDRGVGDDGG
jgi:hypothetical protein